MKNYFLDESIQELIHKFIETERSIYVYNILIRYFYFYFLHDRIINRLNINSNIKPKILDMNDWYTNKIDPYNINNSLDIINSRHWIPLCGIDHTFYYSIDIESNTELFRHFNSYPWTDWDKGIVLEVGSGFGIYSFLFNLFKKYYSLENLQIYSFDFDQYKIDKLRNLHKLLKLVNKNDFILGDCSKKKTFKFLKSEKIYLLYSETFSGKGAHTQDYFKIMNNVFNLDLHPLHLFPNLFKINGNIYSAINYINHINKSKDNSYLYDMIEEMEINNKFQNLKGYDMDSETAEIKEYLKNKFNNRIGFRWGINIV